MRQFERFKSDQRGSVAIMFGLAILPVLGLAGAAIDFGRISYAHTRLQAAVDRAALGIVKLPLTAPQSNMDNIAKSAIEATFGTKIDEMSSQGFSVSMPKVTRVNKTVTIEATGTADMAFMKMFGFDNTKFGAVSKAEWSSRKIELALVLDNTGSMDESPSGIKKITALKTSAKQLLTRLRAEATEVDKVKVSIVPFDTEVRLDPGIYRSKPWFRWNNSASDPAKWTGYLFERYGSYALSAAAPAGSPDTLYPAPVATQYLTTSPFKDLRTASGSLAPIQPLTSLYAASDYDNLNNIISSMTPRGYTNVSLGATMGLVTLTKDSLFPGAADSTDKQTIKYMMVLTDGKNNYRHVNGAVDGNKNAIDSALLTACSNAKNAGVRVFTISLVDTSTTALLTQCASSAGDHYDVRDTSQLDSAFKGITDSILATRITS